MPLISVPSPISQPPPLAPGCPAAADRQRRRAGEGVGVAVVADVGGFAALHAGLLAGVAEGPEGLVAAEVEDDRGAAADRVGDVDAFGVGMGEEGAHVEVGVAVVDPLRQARGSSGARDEGAERGDAAVVGGDELEEVGGRRWSAVLVGPLLTQWPAVRTSCRVGLLIAVPEQ